MTFTPRAARPAVAASAVALAAAVALLAPTTPAYAAGNAVPSYEVKINLTAAALDASHNPGAAVKSAFGITGSAKTRSYGYYDTDALALDAQGWSVRLRHKDGSNFEETYKKRFPVTGGDINAALTTANAAGFDSGDTNYKAEVDWGYAKQTLSFSNEKSHSAKNYSGTTLPTDATGRDWLVADTPGKLADWNGTGWGTTTLQGSRLHGGVTAKVYGGAWGASDDASIEVLPVVGAGGTGTEYVVELSFKTASYTDAAKLHTDAIALAEANGWLYHGDILKTQLILDRY
ncbi:MULTISPECIES: hypothetical protein [unclassified Streptomyces]|uniref:hypothetical protein n=1 Tax=unclassified Streptomyces TaxID=2593676 RepID=UPI00166016B6|nr:MULTISPECIES: hypothetical protein [unclassified Streptomyces]MBD0709822.1 hypothetical protein [Streptomyces sp. CBMA291]MBD0717660.1 hypothetical protein [Streptomyces sp. CBMA370]